MTIRQLRWTTIVAPILFLGVFTYVAHSLFEPLLESWIGFTLILALAAVVVALFSHLVFGIIERLESRVSGQNRELSAVSSIATALSEPVGVEQALQVSLDTAIDVMGASAGVICILDVEREELHSAAHRGLSPAIIERVRRQKVGDDPIGSEVIRTGRSVVIADAFDDPRVAELCRQEGYHSTISVPVKSEGRVVGILALVSRDESAFGVSAIQLLERIGQQVGIAVEKTLLFRELTQRNRDLTALNDVAAAVSSTLDLQGIMSISLDRAMALASCRSGDIWLRGNDRSRLILAAHRGPDGRAPESSSISLSPGEGLCGRVLVQGETTLDLADNGSGEQVLSVALPLKSAGDILGVVCFTFDRGYLLLERTQELLEAISSQIAVAIKNAQLYEQVQDVVILEERDRIAREMHDGFAQVLGYVNTKAQAVRHLLATGRSDEAAEMVAQLEEAAREVYVDVREAILGLRATAQDDRRLVPRIRDYLDVFGRLADLKVNCRVENGADVVDLPVAAEIQLLRIVQEALSNVRKHAGATGATVRLRAKDGCLRVIVKDNGHGFDPGSYDRGDWPQFGLKTMKERSEAVGGTFQLRSAPGKGTTIAVTVPLARGRES
ncbi:MAG: GAF domain-containing sensor histidine kinase [Dehalococcoidia bacterium]|nr:GAF domain-containing sensor histidine kinase [Dehalococcoidia bacterium]